MGIEYGKRFTHGKFVVEGGSLSLKTMSPETRCSLVVTSTSDEWRCIRFCEMSHSSCAWL
jgi:hypothetical protein